MNNYLIFLALLGCVVTQNVTVPFDFFSGGSYLAKGVAVVYSPQFGAPIINNSSIAIDTVNNRIMWKTGAGGSTLFTANATYGRLDALYPGVLFRVTKRDGSDITVFDEIAGYKRLGQALKVITKDPISLEDGCRRRHLKKSKDMVYSGIADDAQRCGFPVSASMYVNEEYDALTRIVFDQLFVAEVAPSYYLPVTTSLRITFNEITLGVPDESEFDLGLNLNGPAQDWCSVVTGGYLPLIPQLGGY